MFWISEDSNVDLCQRRIGEIVHVSVYINSKVAMAFSCRLSSCARSHMLQYWRVYYFLFDLNSINKFPVLMQGEMMTFQI